MKYSILFIAFFCVTILNAQNNKVVLNKSTTRATLNTKVIKAKPVSKNINKDLRTLVFDNKNRTKVIKAKPVSKNINKDLRTLVFDNKNRTKAIKAKPVPENISKNLKSIALNN